MGFFSKSRVLIILMTTFCKGFADTSKPLEFINEPPFRVEFSNTTGTKIQCTATGSPPINITWILGDGNPVPKTNQLRHVTDEGSLVFPSFEAKSYRQDMHAVTYKCTATNAAGTIISREVHVQAVMDEPFEPHVYDAFATTGSTAAIKCMVSGSVAKYVTIDAWIKDNREEIKTSFFDDKKYTVTRNGDLLITNVGSSNAGHTYRCIAKHRLTGQVKTSSTTGKLFVTELHGNVPTKILDIEQTVSAVLGTRAVLPCVSQGNPTPTIKWFKKNNEGVLIPIDLKNRLKTTALALIISNVQENDAGLYICIAENNIGSTRIQLSLKVQQATKISLTPPHMKLQPQVNHPLVCDVKTTSEFTISWYRNGNLMPEKNGIDKLIPEQSGIYQCFAKTEDDIVHATAQISSGANKPVIIKRFEEKILHSGNSASLECTATANPIPNITWYCCVPGCSQNYNNNNCTEY